MEDYQKKKDIELINQYLKNLSSKEKKGYEIAKSHLGMSFQIEKSLGFLQYKNFLENKNT
jgi:hypothetical protein